MNELSIFRKENFENHNQCTKGLEKMFKDLGIEVARKNKQALINVLGCPKDRSVRKSIMTNIEKQLNRLR